MDVQAPLVLLRADSTQLRTHGGIWLVLVGTAALEALEGVWAWTPAARRAARARRLALNNMIARSKMGLKNRHLYISNYNVGMRTKLLKYRTEFNTTPRSPPRGNRQKFKTEIIHIPASFHASEKSGVQAV